MSNLAGVTRGPPLPGADGRVLSSSCLTSVAALGVTCSWCVSPDVPRQRYPGRSVGLCWCPLAGHAVCSCPELCSIGPVTSRVPPSFTSCQVVTATKAETAADG